MARQRARPRPPRSPCSRAATSSSTTCRARPTTSPRSTATSTSARSRTCCPGMEAAFVDIGTPKNAVLYRGDVQYDAEDVEEKGQRPHRADPQGQADHPLPGHQEPDRPQGRPPHPGGVAARAGSWCSSPTAPPTASPSGCADDERKRLRQILDKVRPDGHGLIVRTAAEGVTAEEIERDVAPAARSSGSRSRRWPPRPRPRRCSTASPTWRCGSSARSSTTTTAASSSTTEQLFDEVRDYVDAHLAGAGRPGAALRPRGRAAARCSSATTCTSSSTRRSTARCGCRRAARSSSSTPRRSRSST